MNRVIIVQARMNSTRLPGKVLMDIGGQPMLKQQIRRLQECQSADEIVIATTTNPSDDPIVELSRQEGINFFRGSEHDVLSRFVGAAQKTHADVIIRVTADCPFIDPYITDQVINELVHNHDKYDYVSNIFQRTYPRGLDVEAFFLDTLIRIDRFGQSEVAREHVTIVPRMERPDLFLCGSVADEENNSDLRWTVDYETDLHMTRLIYQDLDMTERFIQYPEILAYFRNHPEFISLNATYETWDPAK